MLPGDTGGGTGWRGGAATSVGHVYRLQLLTVATISHSDVREAAGVIDVVVDAVGPLILQIIRAAVS